MNTTKQTEELSAEFQRKVGDMVHREVVYCVSHLMSEILPGMVETGEYTEEAQSLLYGRTSWVPWNYNWNSSEEEFDTEEKAETWIADRVENGDLKDSWQIEERIHEIFEHWLVTYWLKEKLLEKGEIVEDIHGVDVWARPCTGQAIHLDGVICDIYREMNL